MKHSEYWKTPVEIVLQSGLVRSFKHPYDALDFLEYEWPTRRGAARRQAIVWCLRALEAAHVGNLARRAFMRAAHEAGLLIPANGVSART